MARKDEIRTNAQKSLEAMQENEDYQYLLKNCRRIEDKAAKGICLWNVIGYVRGLQEYIKRDSVIEMRRFERPESYLQSFKVCRERMEKILDRQEIEKEGQLTIFDFL